MNAPEPETTVAVIDDVSGSRYELDLGLTWRESFWNACCLVRSDKEGDALRGCVHWHADGQVTLHFWAEPGREAEALADLKAGGILP